MGPLLKPIMTATKPHKTKRKFSNEIEKQKKNVNNQMELKSAKKKLCYLHMNNSSNDFS